MADERDHKDVNLYTRRAGTRIPIVKPPHRFTVRLKRGETVAAHYRARHRPRLRRQDLEHYSVDAAERDAVMDRARRRGDVEFASHVYAPAEEPPAPLYLTDPITVQFKSRVSDDDIKNITTELGLSLVKHIRSASRISRVGPPATEHPIKSADRLAENAPVLMSEPNVVIASRSHTHLHTPEIAPGASRAVRDRTVATARALPEAAVPTR